MVVVDWLLWLWFWSFVGFFCVCVCVFFGGLIGNGGLGCGFAGGNNGLRKREIGRERKNKKRIKHNKERIFK